MSPKDVWTFRIVHQDTGKPAPGVPVTVLDGAGNSLAHLASDAAGLVQLPRRQGPRLRLRVGLRSEEPIELATATLGDQTTDLVAPSRLPELHATDSSPLPPSPDVSPRHAAPPPAAAASDVTPAHVVYFQRLAMFAETQLTPASQAEADFFALATPEDAPLRYGVVVEVEESWQSLGVQWGDLLYSVALTPGDEARLAVLDGRWRKETDARERPIQILARMVGTSMLGDLSTSLRSELLLEPVTISVPALDGLATETLQALRERTERQSHALRRRPLGVVEAPADAPASAAVRVVRNTTTDRLVTFHFFEPLERFRVVARSPRIRPVVFVPFRLPNVATPDVVRRFGHIFRRTLQDRALLPELDRLLGGEDLAPTSRLLEHVAANLLYYSTAIIAAGDPEARHVALSKLRDPAGRPLTDGLENIVLGRMGNYIALPLRSNAPLLPEWREAVTAFTVRPSRIHEDFIVTIPHAGVWVTAQPHEPMQQMESSQEKRAG
jgi:hypothetical protein